jgi:hypothetical protein
MFNWRRLGRFLACMLGIAIPFLVMAFGLAVVTELITHQEELPDAVATPDFWLSLGLNMLPMVAAMVLVLWFAGRFLVVAYRLGGWREGMAFLVRSRCGLQGFRPWARIEKGAICKGGTAVLDRAGGPGNLVVYQDSAVVLEQGGRLTRIVGKGIHEVGRFEKIYDVIDLRPKRAIRTVKAMTREGIPVRWDVELQYQIDSGHEVASDHAPYPMSPDVVLRAATSKWVSNSRSQPDLRWEDRLTFVEIDRHLRLMLASRRLDQLIGLTEDQRAVREAIQAELETRVRQAAPKAGAKILGVRLDSLSVEDAVTQQWIKAWKANWQNWSAKRLAHAEAASIHQYEVAKAEAQMQMTSQITEAIQQHLANRTIPAQALPQMILMRLFSVLDRADFAPASRVFFPTQTMNALAGIRRALAPGETSDPGSVLLTAKPDAIGLHDQSSLEVTVLDAWNNPLPDGTLVHVSTTLGTLAPASVAIQGGRAVTTLFGDGRPGTAVVTAESHGLSGAVTVLIH